MEEFYKRLVDYFEPYDLVDLLNVTTNEVIEAFKDHVDSQRGYLEGYMYNGD